jgi:chromosomal replication initiator protein
MKLLDAYTFDTYIAGENNSFAAGAACIIALNPGKNYNPLLIYGGRGLGKTHLLQAIGNYIQTNPEYKVLCVSAETIAGELISALTKKSGPARIALKKKYRQTDVLLVDDIQYLRKKEGTQSELFYTFNALYNANKQIVFTCDGPVSAKNDFIPPLRYFVNRGLIVKLGLPDYQTRCLILKKKAEARGVTVPDSVIKLLSKKNIPSNGMTLESTLNTLLAYTLLKP